MKEVKPSKKPLAIYYAIVLLVLLGVLLICRYKKQNRLSLR